MAASSSETTPLLADTTHIVETHDTTLNAPSTSDDVASLPVSAHFPRTRKMLSILILIASAITIILIAPTRILVIKLGSFNYFHGELLFYTMQLLFLMMSTSALATINLIWNFPIFLNIIFDVYIIYQICVRMLVLPALPNEYWCRPINPPPIFRKPECDAKLLALQILLGFVIGLASVVALGHLVLLVLRNIAVERTKFWRRTGAWPFPPGQITCEVSIKA
ncbi:hypothetical protein EG329_007414 [Mollisiaceae sp. DMI_Dod_QoI]|nr:hypothetical protein EG329_007414 [Helotiales sp. DMI_Dod_QoI]